jgi:ferric-dicitrate binding protein FerR (iron transport regulator)
MPPASTNAPEPERPRSLSLPAGESRLDDGSRVRLARTSSAAVENSPGGVRVGLEQGTITVDVAKQAEGQTFEVRANAYRFVAIGTSFTVSTSGDRVELDVREGRVAVLRGSNELARVGAGESWPPASSPAPRAPEAAAPGGYGKAERAEHARNQLPGAGTGAARA